ncbi:MAG: glutathione S-transferase N-terminal domain-containing protein [Polyangiaceae bacterium]|nr:glutathione S-transferase N-terminal domain-containing protein [Polyangiaceae bacterium]
MLTLLYLHYSPWSEKAAWALDHHRVLHARKDYLPLLGEPLLRLRVKKWRGPVTVPVLFGGHDVWEDSLSIARYAESVGSGTSLFPGGTVSLDGRLLEYDRVADELMNSGRARAAERAAPREDVLVESLPPAFRISGPVAPHVGRLGVEFLRRKYLTRDLSSEQHLQRMRRALDGLRAALAPDSEQEGAALASPDAYVLGKFSYVDIAFCAALQFVRPVADSYIRLGPASRDAWTDPALGDYADLLAWRDRVYDAHRR